MQEIVRFTPVPLLALALTAPAGAKAAKKATAEPKPPQEVEYRRADANFYLRSSVLQADDGAAIVAPADYTQKGDTYEVAIHHKAPHDLYVQVTNDWLEPITPPSMPASLDIAPNVMQIREPHGDVTVELPSNPDHFVPVTDRMVLPNGSVVKTGDDASTAVLFGGINSARLTPHSWAEMQQTVTPKLRETEVDLRSGAVFSKVGLRPGERQSFRVKTPFGIARARGTDFLTVTGPDHVDVFVAQGTVELDNARGDFLAETKSAGQGALQLLQSRRKSTGRKAPPATVTDELTMAMNFIPTVDLKIKALRDQVAQGGKLSDRETAYLKLIRKVPSLIKLTMVAPPAPPIPPPAPVAPPTPPAAPPMPLPTATTDTAPAPTPAPVAAAMTNSAPAVPPMPLPTATTTPAPVTAPGPAPGAADQTSLGPMAPPESPATASTTASTTPSTTASAPIPSPAPTPSPATGSMMPRADTTMTPRQ